jgi:hypothetical protein
MHARQLIVSAALALGCAVGEGSDPDEYGFGGASATAVMTASPSEDDDDGGEDGSESSSSAAGESTSGEEGGGSSSESAGTFGPGDESSGGPGATTVDPSGGDPNGGQPGAGMYSACLQPADCAGLDACMQIVDANMQPTDGFCTVLGCANAAVDCDPSPGGTATATCYAVQTQMGADAICALDCGGGKTCPAGMQCTNLTGGQLCV